MLVWLGVICVTAVLGLGAADQVGFRTPVAILLAVLLAIMLACAWRFLAAPIKGRGKLIENAAGIWTLVLYTSIGLIPMAYRQWGG